MITQRLLWYNIVVAEAMGDLRKSFISFLSLHLNHLSIFFLNFSKNLAAYLMSHPDLEGKIDVQLQQGNLSLVCTCRHYSLDPGVTGNFEVILLAKNQLVYSKKTRNQVYSFKSLHFWIFCRVYVRVILKERLLSLKFWNLSKLKLSWWRFDEWILDYRKYETGMWIKRMMIFSLQYGLNIWDFVQHCSTHIINNFSFHCQLMHGIGTNRI